MKVKSIIKILSLIIIIVGVDMFIRLLFGMDFYSLSKVDNFDFANVYNVYSFSNISDCYSKLDSIYDVSTTYGWKLENINDIISTMISGIYKLDYRLLSAFILPFVPIIFLIIFIVSRRTLKKRLSKFNLDVNNFSGVHSKILDK
ncbi:MAG: hypothetical protein ACI3ZZ_04860 [Candidatus Aphodosoma sp.]